ncbi:hypothetical protein [Sphingobium aromaticiconvertens]|uniref:hypothetical protein n=1 Tax=Sphingobium aromaticiconvertens TaxID=365341 RepID=UPI003016AFB6
MPAMRMQGQPRIKLRHSYTLGGQDFLVLTANRVNAIPTEYHGPERPYNVQFGHYLGEPGWVAMEVRPGDRPAGDSLLVNRIGLDGWIDPFPTGDRVLKLDFSVVFGPGCTAVAPNTWINFCEIHAMKIKGVEEYETAGPFRLSYEWSTGSAMPIFRIYKSLQVYDANGLATDVINEIVFQASSLINPTHNIVEGVKYDFLIELYANDTSGYLHVWKDGDLIVDLNDQHIGFGVERRPYPQFRIYRAARDNTAKMLVKVHEVTSFKVPDLPGVTRGPELISDGMFPINNGRWTDIDSAPGCSMEWESDGAGGGFMRSVTLWDTGDHVSPARFKRRLDILEIGETYELKSSGTFGVGAGRTDGGYFNASQRYLSPSPNPDGSEVVRQFVATQETVFLGGSNAYPNSTVDSVSLKRVIVPA